MIYWRHYVEFIVGYTKTEITHHKISIIKDELKPEIENIGIDESKKHLSLTYTSCNTELSCEVLYKTLRDYFETNLGELSEYKYVILENLPPIEAQVYRNMVTLNSDNVVIVNESEIDRNTILPEYNTFKDGTTVLLFSSRYKRPIEEFCLTLYCNIKTGELKKYTTKRNEIIETIHKLENKIYDTQ